MDVSTWILSLGAASTALGAVRQFVYVPLRNGVRRVRTTLDQVATLNEAFDFDPNGKSRVLDKVDRIEEWLGPNSGKSLADKVDRIEKQGIRSGELLEITNGGVQQVANQIERPLYQTDQGGLFVRTNEAFSKLVGYPPEQLLGMGWVSLLIESEKDRVLKEMEWARKDRRAYKVRALIDTAAGVRIDALMTAQPKVDGTSGLVLAWFGALEVQKVSHEKAS